MTTNKTKPEHTVKFGAIRAAIWKNTGEKGVWYNVTIGRTYKKGSDFKESASFRRDDLPLVKLAVDEAYAWLANQRD